MRTRSLLRLTQSIVLCLAVSATAFAQYGGGSGGSGNGSGGYTAPAGGYGAGKAIGIGVGIAAAVAGIALYVHHRHQVNHKESSLTGRSQSTRNAIRVKEEKANKTQSLNDSGAFKPSELNEPNGKRTTDDSGISTSGESIGGAPPPMPPSEVFQSQTFEGIHLACSVQANACTPSASL